MRKKILNTNLEGRPTCRISEWCASTGMGRTKTYGLIAEGRLEAVRVDDMTFIVVKSGLRLLGLDKNTAA